MLRRNSKARGLTTRPTPQSRAGVRTPLAGWVTALVVLVALYGLTPAFKWIPSATLSAVISKSARVFVSCFYRAAR